MANEEISCDEKWKNHFMAHACLNALRSKIESKRRGACLIDKRYRIIGNAHNGRPYIHNTEIKEKFYGARENVDEIEIGAVENVFYFKNKPIEEGCKLYLTHFPTRDEIGKIITNNVETVIYSEVPDGIDEKAIKEEFKEVVKIMHVGATGTAEVFDQLRY